MDIFHIQLYVYEYLYTFIRGVQEFEFGSGREFFPESGRDPNVCNVRVP